jgi:large repetitive protein
MRRYFGAAVRSMSRRPLLLAALCGVLLTSGSVRAEKPGMWSFTGSMTTTRYSHTATRLFDGRVLVFSGPPPSGTNGPPLSSAELYDHKTGICTLTGSLNDARTGYATALLNNGKVLVAGGVDNTGNRTTTAELYDPATGVWTFTGSILYARSDATATRLTDGRVLVVGGQNNGYVLPSELYDPDLGTWSPTGSLLIGRTTPRIVRLLTGGVLVVGGPVASGSLAEAEVYDPTSGTWSTTGSLSVGREGHTATLLFDGKVLVAGGANSTVPDMPTSELYDPNSGTWMSTGSMNTGRNVHTATLLRNGEVLVTGGLSAATGGYSTLASAELYDAATGTWRTTDAMNQTRAAHVATLLLDGQVLVTGGIEAQNGFTTAILASAELYRPRQRDRGEK